MPVLPSGSLPLVQKRNRLRPLSVRHITDRSGTESRMAAGVSIENLSSRACLSRIGLRRLDLGYGHGLPGISAIEVVGIDLRLCAASRRNRHCCSGTQRDYRYSQHTKGFHKCSPPPWTVSVCSRPVSTVSVSDVPEARSSKKPPLIQIIRFSYDVLSILRPTVESGKSLFSCRRFPERCFGRIPALGSFAASAIAVPPEHVTSTIALPFRKPRLAVSAPISFVNPNSKHMPFR